MKKSKWSATHLCALSLLLLIGALSNDSSAAPGDVDLSFDPGSGLGVNGSVDAVAVQSDGKVIIVGDFSAVKGLARSRIARLNADGSGDATFDAGPQIYDSGFGPRSVTMQPDGKVLVGDDYGIKRLNSDGSLDTNFNALIYSDYEGYAPIHSILVQPDGKVLVAGYILTHQFATNWNYGITRLNSNGSSDNSFIPTMGAVGYGTGYSLALQPDGKVLVGGQFNIGGTTNRSVFRLNSNGSLDSSFTASGEIFAVYSLGLQADGNVIIAGNLIAGGGTNKSIARLNANGTWDASFNARTELNGVGKPIQSVALQSDGRILIGGDFNSVNGTNRNRIARLNSDGSVDLSFNPGTGANAMVRSIKVQANGQIVAGGWFNTFDWATYKRIVRLNADGSLDSGFASGSGLDFAPYSAVVQSDGKVLLGGLFTFINGTNRYGNLRLNADGSLDNTFVANTFQPDIGFSPHSEYDYSVATCFAVQSDGKVLVGGYFARYECDFDGCYFAYYILFVQRLNANGSRDNSFSATATTEISSSTLRVVRALAVQPDGKVVVGGNFSSVGGSYSNGVARLNSDGTLDSSFNAPGVSNVHLLKLQPDGKVLVANGAGGNQIVRLNANGTLDNSFNPCTASALINSVALQQDGKVLIGGAFTNVNGTIRNRIARLTPTGSLDNTFDPGTGANGVVRSIALQSDGNVIISGDFLSVSGVPRGYLARLYGDSAAPSLNITGSGSSLTISWPAAFGNFQLQENTNVSLANGWSAVAASPSTNNSFISVTLPATGNRKFFRLSLP